jgi:hypothetical protein
VTAEGGIRGASIGFVLAVCLLASESARAGGGCDVSTITRLTALQHLADSVRVDKPGLARVYAEDGTEFTASQAWWIKGQLRAAEAACARGDSADAAHRLDTVGQFMHARSRQNL